MSVRANSVAVSLLSWVAPQREKSSRSAFGSRGPRCRLRSSLCALVFPLCPTRLAASKSQARPVAYALFLETQICSAWNEETSSISVGSVALFAAHTVRVLPVKVRPQELVMSLCSYTRRLIEATLGGESSKVNVLVGEGPAIHRAAA